MISRKTSLSVGKIVLLFNIALYLIASCFFGWDRALYSLLTYFITFKVIDIVEEGFEQAKSVLIITNHADDIANDIYVKLGRTVTLIEGKGLISGEKVVIMVFCTRMEIPEIKKIVNEDDNSAFVTISDVSEIYGKHIKQTPEQNVG